jgi:hypothetical protein
VSKRLSKPKLLKLVNDFNREFPVGTKVILRKDTAEVETTVRYAAEMLSGHSPVAWFTGVSGCYSIEDNRVRRAPTASDGGDSFNVEQYQNSRK